MRENIRTVGIVASDLRMDSAVVFFRNKGFVVGGTCSVDQIDWGIFNGMLGREVRGIVAEFTGEKLPELEGRYIEVGQEVPLVAMVDWVNDRDRKVTGEMKRSGLGVVRFDLANDDLSTVYEKVWHELVLRMSGREESQG